MKKKKKVVEYCLVDKLTVTLYHRDHVELLFRTDIQAMKQQRPEQIYCTCGQPLSSGTPGNPGGKIRREAQREPSAERRQREMSMASSGG